MLYFSANIQNWFPLCRSLNVALSVRNMLNVIAFVCAAPDRSCVRPSSSAPRSPQACVSLFYILIRMFLNGGMSKREAVVPLARQGVGVRLCVCV